MGRLITALEAGEYICKPGLRLLDIESSFTEGLLMPQALRHLGTEGT